MNIEQLWKKLEAADPRDVDVRNAILRMIEAKEALVNEQQRIEHAINLGASPNLAVAPDSKYAQETESRKKKDVAETIKSIDKNIKFETPAGCDVVASNIAYQAQFLDACNTSPDADKLKQTSRYKSEYSKLEKNLKIKLKDDYKENFYSFRNMYRNNVCKVKGLRLAKTYVMMEHILPNIKEWTALSEQEQADMITEHQDLFRIVDKLN